MGRGSGEVVRVPRVFLRGHIRVRVGDESLLTKPPGHELLDVVFRRRHAVVRASGDRVERRVLDTVELLGRILMGGYGVAVPDRRETLDEIA